MITQLIAKYYTLFNKKNKIINKIIILIITIILLFIPTVTANDTLVYIDKNNIDTKYHRLTCNHIVPDGYVSITVEEAFNKGYRSCPDCSPVISDAERELKEKEAEEIINLINNNISNNNTSNDTDDRTVYITKTGSKFHAYGCDYLNSTPYKTTITTAMDKGYSPCKVCNPYGLATNFYGLDDNNVSLLLNSFNTEYFIALLIAAIIFMAIPMIVKIKKLMFDNKLQVQLFVVANSAIIGFGYFIFIIINDFYYWNYIIFPFFYGILNYFLLRNNVDISIPTTQITNNTPKI